MGLERSGKTGLLSQDQAGAKQDQDSNNNETTTKQQLRKSSKGSFLAV
jgi:hypothetical protein